VAWDKSAEADAGPPSEPVRQPAARWDYLRLPITGKCPVPPGQVVSPSPLGAASAQNGRGHTKKSPRGWVTNSVGQLPNQKIVTRPNPPGKHLRRFLQNLGPVLTPRRQVPADCGLTAARAVPLKECLSLFNQKSTICLDQFCGQSSETRASHTGIKGTPRGDKTAVELFVAVIRGAGKPRCGEYLQEHRKTQNRRKPRRYCAFTWSLAGIIIWLVIRFR
jgi:hypothetical protein